MCLEACRGETTAPVPRFPRKLKPLPLPSPRTPGPAVMEKAQVEITSFPIRPTQQNTSTPHVPLARATFRKKTSSHRHLHTIFLDDHSTRRTTTDGKPRVGITLLPSGFTTTFDPPCYELRKPCVLHWFYSKSENAYACFLGREQHVGEKPLAKEPFEKLSSTITLAFDSRISC